MPENNIQLLTYIALGLGGFTFLALIWVALRIKRLDRIRKEFFSSEQNLDLEQVLVDQNRLITKLRTDLEMNSEEIRNLQILNQSNYQKIGFVRFNPFDDAGGNISFTLCLLNARNDGVVISSLHGREGTRMYAKNVRAGISESKLTEEEEQAIKEAK